MQLVNFITCSHGSLSVSSYSNIEYIIHPEVLSSYLIYEHKPVCVPVPVLVPVPAPVHVPVYVHVPVPAPAPERVSVCRFVFPVCRFVFPPSAPRAFSLPLPLNVQASPFSIPPHGLQQRCCVFKVQSVRDELLQFAVG